MPLVIDEVQGEVAATPAAQAPAGSPPPAKLSPLDLTRLLERIAARATRLRAD